jgi:hypothetical protein
MKYCPKKQVLNIGSGLTIQVELEWETLKDCIKEAVMRCEALRVQFAEDKDGNVYQYVAKDQEINVEHFDFSHWKVEDAHDKMTEWTSTPFELYDTPMYQIVMIKMPNQFHGVYLKVNHLIMDAQSLIVFMKDVMELYSHKVYGVNWGGGDNVMKLFYNDDSEYWMGDFYWMYHSFRYISDVDLRKFKNFETSELIKKGDVNNDGQVLVDDVVKAINYVIGEFDIDFNFSAGDMNNDNQILVDDIVAIINKVIGS